MKAFAFALAFALLGATPAVQIVSPETGGQAWSTGEVAALRADVDTLLAGDAAVRGAHVGVLALETRSGDVLYAHDADDEFQPASTLKLLVGSVALEKLGPAYRFTTRLERVDGRLVLRAGGDPSLASADFDGAVAAARDVGVANLRGVAIDATRYDTPPYPAGWVWDDFAYAYAAPVSAAAVDENVATYAVAPGAAAGDAVRITLGNAAVTLQKMCPGLLDHATTGSPNSSVTLDSVTLAPDCAALVGSLPARGAASPVDVAVRDPQAHFAAAFAARADATGQREAPSYDPAHGSAPTGAGGAPRAPGGAPGSGIRGPLAAGSGAASQTLWRHDSQPLGTWLGPGFWIPSDNFVAEQLLCEVGYVAGGAPGSTAGGLAVERSWLSANGIDPATTTLADGSGLSQYDRITPRALAAILQHDWNGPYREIVLDSLPVGGGRGTIEGVVGTPAAGRVFAKTGSMSHVRGLAGFLATQRHGAVTFAFNVDDWNGDYGPLAALRARVLTRFIEDAGPVP